MKIMNSSNKTSFPRIREAFRNEEGAIDLASIMVGIIVIGLIGGVIAATVFAVIPWAQDNAAKQQLDAVVTAQSAKAGLNDGKYSTDLGSFLDTDSAKIGLRSNNSNCYGAFVTSASGNNFYVSSAKTQPVKIAANAAWPSTKPADYPAGCLWPAGTDTAVSPSVQNFVINSSFETDASGVTSVGAATKTIARTQSATAHSGNYIFQVSRVAQANGSGYAFLTPELEPGNYVSSMKIRSTVPVTASGYNEGAVYTERNIEMKANPGVVLSNEWKTIYTEFTVINKTIVKAGFLAGNAASGETIDIDSVQVVKATGNLTKDTTFGGY
jgi:hypothetical protein